MITNLIDNTFIIPINKNYLIYYPLIGLSALINKNGARELLNQLDLIPKNQGDNKSKLYDLADEILKGKVQSPVRKTGSLNPDFLGIIPTRTCNGACNYCDFGADKAPEIKIAYQMAAKAVDWYANLLEQNGRNQMDIHFFGGEPMMAQDVIEVVIQRAKLVASEKELIPFFEISTNGQYTREKAFFLGNYFNKVVLSLDGFEEFHNMQRPVKSGENSFKRAVETAEIISNSNAELSIRCCISQLNVAKMEAITEWFCKKFRLSPINFEILCASPLTELKGLYPPDPVDFAVHFQKSREIAQSYNIPLVYASDIGNNIVVSSCPVGKDVAIFSPDGRISNCYLMPEKWINVGLDLDFGGIVNDDKITIESNKVEMIRKMVENKPRCEECFCKWSCAGGCHVGITYPNSSCNYDNFCKQTRLISVFSLLSGLGMNDKINELQSNWQALESINKQKSDLITNFKY